VEHATGSSQAITRPKTFSAPIATNSDANEMNDSCGSLMNDSCESLRNDSCGSLMNDSHGSLMNDSCGSLMNDSCESLRNDSCGSLMNDSGGSLMNDSCGSLMNDSCASLGVEDFSLRYSDIGEAHQDHRRAGFGGSYRDISTRPSLKKPMKKTPSQRKLMRQTLVDKLSESKRKLQEDQANRSMSLEADGFLLEDA
jgi:hypothetical protein